MIKSINYRLIIFPLILNIIIIILIIIPSKINKFHPIILIFLLIIITLLISIKINFIYNSWLSFILLLIIIGGLIVIFIYITRLTNNELFYFNIKLILLNFLKITPILILFYFIYNQYKFNRFNIQDSWIITKYAYLYNQININIIYIKFNNKSTFFIIIYLYYSIICIINICYKFKSPLRQLIY